MNRKQLKSTIRSHIFSLLKEQAEEKPKEAKPKAEKPKEEKPKEAKPKRGKKARPGEILTKPGRGGRYKAFVAEAGARAKKEPKALMKDLGVTSSSGGDDLSQVLSILNTAIHTNMIMSQSYSGARLVREKNKEGEVAKGVGISLRGLDDRNGMKFLSHTLHAAKNAGFLKLRGGVKIGPGDSSAIVIFSI